MRNGKLKKTLSGILAGLTLLSTVLSPAVTVSAAEPAMEESKPPLYEEVKDQLDADEVVTAKDLEIGFGSDFDEKCDFSNMEIKDNLKVTVTFQEAKNDAGDAFSTDCAGTYKAVYYVTPANVEHPEYQISRNLIVKTAVGETSSQSAGTSDQDSDGESSDDGEGALDPGISESEEAQDGRESTAEQATETIDAAGNTGTEFLDVSGTDGAAELVPESETELETDTDSDTDPETEDEGYKVEVIEGTEYNVTLDHEDGIYEPGETVRLTTDLPAGSLAAVSALKVEANETEDTADILYSEVSYDAAGNTFSFEMPEDDIALAFSEDYAEADAVALPSDDEGLWDEATEIEANKYYYYSDGTLHPFNSVMGSGGNDSYKYVRYKVDGKTYTVHAYCMQHSMTAPPSGTTYTSVVELDEGGDDKYLRKALFYGYGGPGWGGTFNGYNIQSIMESYGCGSETRAMQHYLVDYLYDGESGFGGALSDTAKAMLKEIKAALKQMPDPTGMELQPGLSVTADGTQTESFKWKANVAFTITISLEDGVSLVNETTGKTSTGKATVKGGESFHLVATTSDISKLKGSYKITSNYPLDFHAMMLKLKNSQDIGFGYYTGGSLTLTVEWPEEASVSITKKDAANGKKLSGAVYGIYSDADCKNLLLKMPETDSNGTSTVTFVKTQETVYLKEITAPSGYVADVSTKNIKLVVAKTTSQEVTDKEQLAQLTIYKTGEVLTGASVKDSGVSFQYSSQKLKGAKFNVYAAADIKSASGELVCTKGTLVAENLTTDSSGSAILTGLHLGSYTVTETGAPANYVNTGESKTVKLTYAGQNVETVFSEMTFNNDRQKAKVTVTKKDSDTENPLPGGIYGLYAASDIKDVNGNVIVKKGTLIEKATTGTNSSAAYTADLPIGYSYSIKEVQAPDLYYRNQQDVYTFSFAYTNDQEASVSFSHTFTNDRVNAEISLVKRDAETGDTAQGDATLEGAVYGLYAREDIVHPDGKTGVIYKVGTKIAELTTDSEGKASISDLYLGKYYLKEITPSEGYLLDETEYDLDCSYEGDMVPTVKRDATSNETVIKQPFQMIKAADNGKTDADLLEGVGFTAYLVSSLKTNEDGSYDFSSAEPVVIGENGTTEIFTDEKGYAVSIALPYGTYVVRETTTPHNFTPVDDFIVTITENHPNDPQVWRVLLDDEFEAKLKIVKKDAETKKSVLIPDTEFKIYDLENQKYVEQVTTYPVTVTHKSYFTDSQGYLILPQNLKCGDYRIEEVTAPEGYTINKNYVEVKVDTNTAYQVDSQSGDAIIEVAYENISVKGELTITKTGETVKGFDKDFAYEESLLSGAVFEVYAAEDIYTADYQRDENGNRTLEYVKGDLVTTVTTDENGKAVAENLPLGKYTVKEKTAPEGFVLNTVFQDAEFTYADQETPVIKKELEFRNDRQKVSITVVKKDAENESVVAGAVFGLYAKEDIKAGDNVVVKADTLLEEMTSGKDGKAVSTLDLPLGQYYVKELKAPAGYVSSDEVLDFDASYQGQNVKAVILEADKKNEPTTVEVTKTDITSGAELDGAELKVLDKDGNVIDSWTSMKDAPHVIKRLTAGETYILREEFAPYGYLKTTDVEFTVGDTGEVQPVEMKDEVPTALLIINKKGEFLDKVTLLDTAKGIVENLFEYVSGNLEQVTFEVYAAEDVKAADGVSADYYKADELVGTITTGKDGVAQLGNLPVGKYYVKETETAHGYVLDGESRYVDLTYRDQDTPVVTYSEAWQNSRQKAVVTVIKKEKDTERYLAGAVFGLYAGEDIKSASGEVLLEADTLIEQKTTDANGQITFTADLPVDGNYYVKEISAPDGFVTTGEVQSFTFEYSGAEDAEARYEFTFEDEPTTVELSKTDLTTGEELPGAHLKVTDEDGNVVEEWTSTEESHVIKELTVGKEYTLTETKPADGYVTAESITFTIENTAEIKKHEMQDDVTKLKVSKTDITGGQEVPGAKLTILDSNDQVVVSWTSGSEPYYIEKLPVGKYTLREELAPEGYVMATDISFEVKDTAEIQTVSMKDDTAKGKVILNKTDKDSGEPLKGVEFELRDSSGKVLEILKTDAAGHAESALYEIASYKDGEYDEALKYYLVETKTLDGYSVDDTRHEVSFEYQDADTPVIEVKFDLTNEKTSETVPTASTHGTTTSDSPQTGDYTNLWLPVLLLAASTAAMVGAGIILRRRRMQ